MPSPKPRSPAAPEAVSEPTNRNSWKTTEFDQNAPIKQTLSDNISPKPPKKADNRFALVLTERY